MEWIIRVTIIAMEMCESFEIMCAYDNAGSTLPILQVRHFERTFERKIESNRNKTACKANNNVCIH